VFEKNHQQNTSETKPTTTAPPKPPRMTEAERTLHREKSSTKRKAPPPPSDATNVVSKSHSEAVECDYSVVSVTKHSDEVPSKRERKIEKETAPQKPVTTTVDVVMDATPKPRKRTQLEEHKVDTIDKEWDNHNLQELEDMERRMEERKKARMERRGKVEVTVMAEEKTSSRSEPTSSKRVEAVVHVVEVSSPRKSPPRPKARVEVVLDTVDGGSTLETNKPSENISKQANQNTKINKESRTSEQEKQSQKLKEESNSKPVEKKTEVKHVKQVSEQVNQVPDRNTSSGMTEKLDKPVLDKHIARIAEKKKEVQSMIKRASSSYLHPTDSLHRYGSLGEMHAGMDDELNETVNLNDVNIHEMTFTFDFSNFDKIQEDRETKFQKSFNEAQQEVRDGRMDGWMDG